MKFAVTGDSPDALPFLEAVSAAPDREIVLCSVHGQLASEMGRRGLISQIVDSPEELVVDSRVETIIVAERDVDQSLFLCRQSSQAGRHVIAISPHGLSTAYSFELHLLLDESELGILPLSGRWYTDRPVPPSTQPSEDIRQLSLQLSIPADPSMFTALQFEAVDALSGFGYRFSQVTGLDVPGADGQLLSRSITLAASNSSETKVPPAVVSFDDQQSENCGQIVVAETNGKESVIQVALPSAENSTAIVQQTLQRICDELVTPASCQRRMEEFSNTLELMEGLEKSLRRRRTVDVYFDAVSERGAFKTQMTAIGCGVMTYVTFGLIALALAQALGMPAGLMKLGMYVWVGPVVLFLAAQLLLPLARDRSSSTTTSPNETSPVRDPADSANSERT